jgi:hypothetical protein
MRAVVETIKVYVANTMPKMIDDKRPHFPTINTTGECVTLSTLPATRANELDRRLR